MLKKSGIYRNAAAHAPHSQRKIFVSANIEVQTEYACFMHFGSFAVLFRFSEQTGKKKNCQHWNIL
jgi:hypothetical protein